MIQNIILNNRHYLLSSLITVNTKRVYLLSFLLWKQICFYGDKNRISGAKKKQSKQVSVQKLYDSKFDPKICAFFRCDLEDSKSTNRQILIFTLFHKAHFILSTVSGFRL